MKTTKKFLAVLLEALLLVSCMVTAFAVSGKDGNLNWTYDETTKTLTISGTGKMLDYPEDDPSVLPTWFAYHKVVETIVIEEGVTSVGDWAFWQFTALKSVTIPKSIKIVGTGAFGQCQALESVTYNGSEKDWSSIAIVRDHNLALIEANKTYTIASCPWCGEQHEGFFQGIIGFFHRILAAILGANY